MQEGLILIMTKTPAMICPGNVASTQKDISWPGDKSDRHSVQPFWRTHIRWALNTPKMLQYKCSNMKYNLQSALYRSSQTLPTRHQQVLTATMPRLNNQCYSTNSFIQLLTVSLSQKWSQQIPFKWEGHLKRRPLCLVRKISSSCNFTLSSCNCNISPDLASPTLTLDLFLSLYQLLMSYLLWLTISRKEYLCAKPAINSPDLLVLGHLCDKGNMLLDYQQWRTHPQQLAVMDCIAAFKSLAIRTVRAPANQLLDLLACSSALIHSYHTVLQSPDHTL